MSVELVQEIIVRFDPEVGMEYHVKYDGNSNNPKNYTTGDAFRLAMLQADMGEGDVLIKSVVRLPKLKRDSSRNDTIKAFEPIKNWLNAQNVLTAYTTGDNTFAVVRIENGGSFRKWGEFHAFSFNGMEQKAMKRQGMYGTQTYTFDSRNVVFVDDNEFHAPNPNYWTVRVVDTPAWLEPRVDGVFFAREEVRNVMAEDAIERVSDDEDKVAHLTKTLLGTRKFNARFIMPGMTAKGDVAFCKQLNTDFVIHSCNTFTFIHSTDNMGHITITPQEQMTAVRTNRQSITHFWDTLMAVPTPGRLDTQGLVFDAFRDEVNREIKLLRDGKPLSHVAPGARDEDDAIRSVQQKVMLAYEVSKDLNQFPYLVSAQAMQRVDMWDPKDEDDEEKKRSRLPIPHWSAVRASINSEFVYSMIYGERLDLADGECALVPEIGLVVNDHDWPLMLEVLGGADQDDHVEVHFRRVMKRETWMGRTYNEGDIIFFLVRSPIGLASDGALNEDGSPKLTDDGRLANADGDPASLFSEYFILQPNFDTRLMVIEDINDHMLPVIDLTPEAEGGSLPRCTAEMDPELRASGRQPTKRELENRYSKKFFLDTLMGLAENRLVYDTHSAMYRKHRLLGIPFVFKANEDFFIDSAVQFMNPYDLDFIRHDNDEARERINAITGGEEFDSVLSEVVDFHHEQTERFARAARAHLRDVVTNLKVENSGIEFTGPMLGRKPKLMDWVNTAEVRYRERNNKSKLNTMDHEKIGDNLFSGIQLMIDSPKYDLDYDMVVEMIRDARVYLLKTTRPSGESKASIARMFYPMDYAIMRGKFTSLVIDALYGRR